MHLAASMEVFYLYNTTLIDYLHTIYLQSPPQQWFHTVRVLAKAGFCRQFPQFVPTCDSIILIDFHWNANTNAKAFKKKFRGKQKTFHFGKSG